MSPIRPIALVFAAAVTLAACGGSDQPADNGVSEKQPGQILAAMSTALEGVKSYHVDGRETDADGTTSAAADIARSGDLRLRLRTGASSADILSVGRRVYMRANSAFWRSEESLDGSLIGVLADRWILVPGDSIGNLAELTAQLLPKTLAYCSRRPTGKLTKRRSESGGKPVVVVSDDGDSPGDAPGDVTIAASGRPLPLRVVQTGRSTPGGKFDARCDDKHDTTTASDLRFSRYDEPLALAAPKGALDLQSLLGSGGGAPGGTAA